MSHISFLSPGYWVAYGKDGEIIAYISKTPNGWECSNHTGLLFDTLSEARSYAYM